MVSFHCEQCGDVVTKKKLENHLRKCYSAPVTCIDCMTTFYGNDHKSHTSCITEVQKYQGSWNKEKRSKAKGSNPPSAPVTPGYRPPTVEDAPNGTPHDWSVARVEVPPPAPSPPPPEPVNVFDFLVEERSRSASVSSQSSSFAPTPKRLKNNPSSPKKRVQLQEDAVTYGDGPVERSSAKYASDLSLAMDVDSQAAQPLSSIHHTPAPKSLSDGRDSEKRGNKSGSEKKRKRPPVEELDLSESRKSSQDIEEGAPVLHSGLTGGLAKLLGKQDSQPGQASPLSPKKRHKQSRHETDSADGDRDRHRKKRHEKHEEDGTGRHRRHKRHRSDGDEASTRVVKALEPAPEIKALEYHKQANTTLTRTSSRQSYQSHSEFFLSLVTKSRSSHKGQSIYGTLKDFHDGICEEVDRKQYEANGDRLREEKRLLKALRVKMNKNNEIVLFARPDFEAAADGEEKVEQKRIEAP